MKTERCISKDFNVDVISSEIIKLCNNTEFGSNAVGILYCDTEVDSSKLISALSERLSIPIVGGTIMSFLSDDTSAIFTLLYGDDVCFSATAVDLSEGDLKTKIKALYDDSVKALGETPKLIVPFMPFIRNTNAADDSCKVLFELANGIPVFGGVHADDMVDSVAAVFCNKRYTQNSLALLLIGGNIKPLFAQGAGVTKISAYAPLVTRLEGERLYDVDNMPFSNYAKELGVEMTPEGRLNLEYGILSFEELDGLPEYPQLRTISNVSDDQSYVNMTASVPLPSRVSIVMLTKENVISSTETAVADIKKKIAENEVDGYKYSFISCISCASRYFAHIGGKNAEKEFISKELPDGANFYAFGEIGPVVLEQKVQNRLNNVSLVICAI
ncbi:MAG: hypothetical protein LBV04_10220 [Deferribacteraceae bacterium]|jgi:hypothetical protein|nr:hypothetical protein [Deferribacteraceae bacterium]